MPVNKPKQPGKNGVAYLALEQRAVWREKRPGVVKSYHVKPYPYCIGYDVELDDGEMVTNSGIGELQPENGEYIELHLKPNPI